MIVVVGTVFTELVPRCVRISLRVFDETSQLSRVSSLRLVFSRVLLTQMASGVSGQFLLRGCKVKIFHKEYNFVCTQDPPVSNVALECCSQIY